MVTAGGDGGIAGAIPRGFGEAKGAPMKRSTPFAPARRHGPGPFLWLIPLLFVGLVIWLANKDTEVPTERIEVDVTSATLAK